MSAAWSSDQTWAEPGSQHMAVKSWSEPYSWIFGHGQRCHTQKVASFVYFERPARETFYNDTLELFETVKKSYMTSPFSCNFQLVPSDKRVTHIFYRVTFLCRSCFRTLHNFFFFFKSWFGIGCGGVLKYRPGIKLAVSTWELHVITLHDCDVCPLQDQKSMCNKSFLVTSNSIFATVLVVFCPQMIRTKIKTCLFFV